MGFLMTKPKGHPDVLFVNFHLCNVKFQLLNYSSIHKANAFNEAIMGDNLVMAPQLSQTPRLLDRLLLSEKKHWFLMCWMTNENILAFINGNISTRSF